MFRGLAAALLTLGGCAARAGDAAPEPRAFGPPEPNVASYFPLHALDTRCAYSRPIGPSEALAGYVEEIADREEAALTDLDCFFDGRPDPSPPAGRSQLYYYANAFLLVKQGMRPMAMPFDEALRTAGLDHVRPNGEIYYFLASALSLQNITCAQRLAMAANDGGVFDGAILWHTLEDMRSYPGDGRPPDGHICRDPRILALLEQTPRPPQR